MTEQEIFMGWTAILDAVMDETDPPDGLFKALVEADTERAARFTKFLVEIGCAEVDVVQEAAH